MKKKIAPVKKLRLNAETIRELNANQLKEVAGGCFVTLACSGFSCDMGTHCNDTGP